MPNIELLSICIGILSLVYCWQEVTRRQSNEMTLNQQRLRERLVDRIAQQIRQSLDLDRVLATTVTEVQGFLNVDRVLIYRVWEDGTGCVIHETALPPYTRIVGQAFPAEVFPSEYHQAYLLGKTRTIANVAHEDVEACLADFVKQFGVQAKLVVPIIQQQRDREGFSPVPYLWGLLIAHQCSHPREWASWEVDLMQQLATQVAIAIQQSELYHRLQQLNAQLELRVQQRTEELAQTNISLRAEVVERQRTETALRHTNDTLQALIAASPRAIIRLDLAGNVKIWNPAAEQMFGWKEAEVIDRPNPITLDNLDRLINIQNLPAFNPNRSGTELDYPNLFTSILQGKTYSRLELSQQKKDGTPIEIIFSAAPLPNPDGQIGGIVAVIADVTEQKQRAEELRLLQSVVVNTNDAAIVTEAEPIDSPGPRILYVNEAFTRITGYQPEEVLGQSPRILQGAKTDRGELLKVRQALARWEPITVEVINYRKDGSEFWNEFSLVPVGDSNGRYTHWISVQRDTTGRKLAEQALRQSEERFRSLIENALDIIMILDLEGNIAYVSPSVEKVLGYPAIVLVGKNMLDFIHPEDRDATHARFANPRNHPELTKSIAVTDGKPFEFRHCHQDGSWRILEAIGQPFVDSAATRRVMVNARDITERKRLDEIRLALEREKELNTLKTRFFSMASHEFRTPLSTALAAAQVLENSQSEWNNTTKRLRNLHRIQDSVRNMVQLLDDILTINRAETGKLAFNPKSLDLAKFCRHFVEEMRLNSGNKHSISFNWIGTAIAIALDEKLMRSIVANLLSNAIKYSPQGGEVSLTIEFHPDTVSIEVRDRGIGIDPVDRQQLFEPFYRGKNVRTIPGTGLGLVVVKKCVDLHQGSIEILSEVNMGTTCLVTLPISTNRPNYQILDVAVE
jgi:PAS domain S-box-containing protein